MDITMKKALIVGIDHYNNEDNNLSGCIKDAQRMYELLSFNDVSVGESNVNNFSCRLLTSTEVYDKKITRQVLKKEIQHLFSDDEVDVALLYFSGHGYENSLGGFLVTQDAARYDEGVSFNDVMIYANNSSIKEIIIILDCCHSGHLGNVAIAKNQVATLRKGISILTASTAAQVALERPNHGGVFTQLLCNALKGGNADILGNVKLTHLYEHVDRMLGPWEQRPTLKSNSARLSVLRKTQPKVKLETLRKIIEYFISAQYYLPLDPGFEPTERLGDKKKEKIFGDLQKLANNGLVSPVNAEHMYYAAINSKACKLTEHGRQYWDLLNKGRI